MAQGYRGAQSHMGSGRGAGAQPGLLGEETGSFVIESGRWDEDEDQTSHRAWHGSSP